MCYERVGSSNPAWDLSLALSFFQILSSVSAYNNSKFVYHNVFDTFSEVVVSSKYRSYNVCSNARKLCLLFGFLLPASCPLLDLTNGMVTYTDPPINGVHNSFTATHTCSNGYQLVGDSIRICDISGDTGTWGGADRTCIRKNDM